MTTQWFWKRTDPDGTVWDMEAGWSVQRGSLYWFEERAGPGGYKHNDGGGVSFLTTSEFLRSGPPTWAETPGPVLEEIERFVDRQKNPGSI